MRTTVVAAILVITAFPCLGGGSEEATLGSQSSPLQWAFVRPDAEPDLANEIEKALVPVEINSGYSIGVVLLDTYSALLDRLTASAVHIATMPALTYFIASERGLVVPGLVAVHGSPPLSIAIVTDRSHRTLDRDTLVGSVYARHDPYSPMDWLVLRIFFAANGIVPERDLKMLPVDSEEAAYQALADGRANMASFPIRSDGFAAGPSAEGEVSQAALVEYPVGEGIHYHAALPDEIIAGINGALLDLAKSENGLGVFETAFGWLGLEPATEAYFEGYRALLSRVGLKKGDLP